MVRDEPPGCRQRRHFRLTHGESARAWLGRRPRWPARFATRSSSACWPPNATERRPCGAGESSGGGVPPLPRPRCRSRGARGRLDDAPPGARERWPTPKDLRGSRAAGDAARSGSSSSNSRAAGGEATAGRRRRGDVVRGDVRRGEVELASSTQRWMARGSTRIETVARCRRRWDVDRHDAHALRRDLARSVRQRP
jgi:hypothetical protein